jgi:uncharacterized protein
MTDLASPIDGATMRKVRRYGVEIDVCVRTGGVWLDKGELEKIIDMIRDEAEDHGRRVGRRDMKDDDDRGGFDDDDRGRGGKRRSRLSDLFDF